MAQSHSLGQKGEEAAVDYLSSKAYKILETNWLAGKLEVDIIAEHENFIVFAEVKTRTIDFQVHPRDAVSVAKQRNIIMAAQIYIEKKDLEKEVRFDIVSIIFDKGHFEIEHIIDAFYPTL